MFSPPATSLSPSGYLEIERRAEYKSEYFRGEMFAMAGASLRHVQIVSNLVSELGQQLKKRPCGVYSTGLRLRVSETGLYTYPDLMAICGDVQYADDQKDTVLNPVFIVEVLSESTRDYDRGRKFQHYRALPSLKEYLTVAQEEIHAEHWVRQRDNAWLLTEFGNLGETIELRLIGCALPLAEIYDKIQWAAGE
ncbi:MAG: Uma2 family endonuclease [Acidobacteriia bacterium]|nr:Uma2 family endonuclease [Terriglobia bacterium]